MLKDENNPDSSAQKKCRPLQPALCYSFIPRYKELKLLSSKSGYQWTPLTFACSVLCQCLYTEFCTGGNASYFFSCAAIINNEKRRSCYRNNNMIICNLYFCGFAKENSISITICTCNPIKPELQCT